MYKDMNKGKTLIENSYNTLYNMHYIFILLILSVT